MQEDYKPGTPIVYFNFFIILTRDRRRGEWTARWESRDGATVQTSAGHYDQATALRRAKQRIDEQRGA